MLPKCTSENKRLRRYVGLKRLIGSVLLSLFMLLAWKYYKSGITSPIIIKHYISEYPIGSVLLFMAFNAISVMAFLPSLPLNLAAGFFWGGVLGGIYTTISVTFGGWVSFLVARWLIGQPLAGQFQTKWAMLAQCEFQRNGWKFVAFARLNPIIPTGPLNYLLGLTSLSSRQFIWATFMFLLPPSIAIAYIGDTLQTFMSQQLTFTAITRGILIGSGALTFLMLSKFGSKLYSTCKEM